MKKTFAIVCGALLCAGVCLASEDSPGPKEGYRIERAVPYRAGLDEDQTEYIKERCKLDVYFPVQTEGFATVVWFHGGGLYAGNRYIPAKLKGQGIAVVTASDRLHPKVECPAYIEDAAAAVAWTFKNIERYGGSPDRIFVSGHSAGGYLTSMVGLDKRWLAAYGVDANRIAGLVPFSGHTITHFTIRKERGIPKTQPIVDAFAPLYHVRPDAPPLVLITGDRDKELLGRYEETAYLWRMMKEAGHTRTELHELKGYAHVPMEGPALDILLRHIRAAPKPGSAREAEGPTPGV